MSALEGWVYAATNPAFPGLIKIGSTTNPPHQRIKQLSAGTNMPYPFDLAYSRRVAFPFDVEGEIHEILDQYRTNDSREFFAAPLFKVIEIMQEYPEIRGSGRKEMPSLSFAELFATFPDDGEGRELTPEEQAKCRALERRMGK